MAYRQNTHTKHGDATPAQWGETLPKHPHEGPEQQENSAAGNVPPAGERAASTPILHTDAEPFASLAIMTQALGQAALQTEHALEPMLSGIARAAAWPLPTLKRRQPLRDGHEAKTEEEPTITSLPDGRATAGQAILTGASAIEGASAATASTVDTTPHAVRHAAETLLPVLRGLQTFMREQGLSPAPQNNPSVASQAAAQPGVPATTAGAKNPVDTPHGAETAATSAQNNTASILPAVLRHAQPSQQKATEGPSLTAETHTAATPEGAAAPAGLTENSGNASTLFLTAAQTLRAITPGAGSLLHQTLQPAASVLRQPPAASSPGQTAHTGVMPAITDLLPPTLPPGQLHTAAVSSGTARSAQDTPAQPAQHGLEPSWNTAPEPANAFSDFSASNLLHQFGQAGQFLINQIKPGVNL